MNITGKINDYEINLMGDSKQSEVNLRVMLHAILEDNPDKIEVMSKFVIDNLLSFKEKQKKEILAYDNALKMTLGFTEFNNANLCKVVYEAYVAAVPESCHESLSHFERKHIQKIKNGAEII